MLRLGEMEQKKNSNQSQSGKKASAAMLRMQKDLNELSLPETCKIEFPDVDDLLNFVLMLMPDEGYYKAGRFAFKVQILPEYPLTPPKVKCLTKIFHPNIDLEGNVCLNILREEWNPVLNVNAVAYGLLHLFLDPNCTDPLNKEAADLLLKSASKFDVVVKKTIRGGTVNGVMYPGCLKQ